MCQTFLSNFEFVEARSHVQFFLKMVQRTSTGKSSGTKLNGKRENSKTKSNLNKKEIQKINA
jgi:hypothetical protein